MRASSDSKAVRPLCPVMVNVLKTPSCSKMAALNSVASVESGRAAKARISLFSETDRNSSRPAKGVFIMSEGALAHPRTKPDKRTSGYFGYKINFAFGAGNRLPSSPIHDRSTVAINRSRSQTPGETATISDVGNRLKTSFPPK